MAEPLVPAGLTDPQAHLARHAQRRIRSVPTLSVLSGPPGLGVRAWRQWAASQQRSVVQLSCVDAETVVARWTTSLARQRDLMADALAFLTDRTGRPLAELRASWTAKT